jgi:aspartyl-tRNA(Asn)/glutamyl-tRNA(Gln) amidotransferase subunit B
MSSANTNASPLIEGFEVVIGFETHTQLTTQSKIFSRASTAFGAEANTQACAVDLALPGTLPVMNKTAVERAIEFGLAVGGEISERSIFARKNYFYPDLPKGYQISQFEIPVVVGGEVSFFLGDTQKTVRLVRAHLEEDAGKSLHEDFVNQSGIDLNRAGTPLLEIVTEPDMRSSAEAVAYAKELHKIVTWIGICDGNMQEGSFRCDANVSVRRPGEALGTRREIKNLNSFKFMQQAIDYEVRWQIEQILDGHKIIQATVLFNPETGETRSMRTKEDAAEYRYFPDPDLPPLEVSRAWVQEVKSRMGELPRDKAARFVSTLGLPQYDASALTQNQAMANYFEQAVSLGAQAKLVSNWMMGELSRRLNAAHLDFDSCPLSAPTLAALIVRIMDSTLSNHSAKTLLETLWDDEASQGLEASAAQTQVDKVIERLGLKQMNDTSALEGIIEQVIAANPDNVAQIKAGKDKAFNALVGQVMKASKGKANPKDVNDLLQAKLATL